MAILGGEYSYTTFQYFDCNSAPDLKNLTLPKINSAGAIVIPLTIKKTMLIRLFHQPLGIALIIKH